MKDETIGVVIRDPGQTIATEIKEAKRQGRPVMLGLPVSNCCQSPMRVEGDVTMFHVCLKCHKACDPAPPLNPHEQT